MKKLALVVAAVLSIDTSAYAANHVGQCVAQKAKVGKDGRLIPVKQVVVKANPQDKPAKAFLRSLDRRCKCWSRR